MPNFNTRPAPVSVRQDERVSRTSTITIKVNSRIPDQDNPSTFISENRNIVTGEKILTRRMTQKDGSLFFEFPFPPSNLNYDGFGVSYEEIPRPLLRPLIDMGSYQNYKVNFEFLVAKRGDSLVASVDDEINTLQWMSNSMDPVYFENFDALLTNSYWYIAEFSVQTSRVNADGAVTAAQCTIGLLEYQEEVVRFAAFPKLSYKATSKNPKKGGGGGGGGASTPDINELNISAGDQIRRFATTVVADKKNANAKASITPHNNVVPKKKKSFLAKVGSAWRTASSIGPLITGR